MSDFYKSMNLSNARESALPDTRPLSRPQTIGVQEGVGSGEGETQGHHALGVHPPRPPLLELKNVNRICMQGEHSNEVLKPVNMSVGYGEFMAIEGASGSGKSTLLHIMGLLDRPSRGEYLMRGRNTAGLSDDELSDLRNETLGFVFQSFYLIPYATALDNVLLPGTYSRASARTLKERALHLMDLVGLADRLDFIPAKLSGGQQQRVAIARALLNEPAVILADEPTGQLDSSTGKEIMELFSSIHKTGTTIILVTHDAQVAAYAKRRIFIHDGRIVKDTLLPAPEHVEAAPYSAVPPPIPTPQNDPEPAQ